MQRTSQAKKDCAIWRVKESTGSVTDFQIVRAGEYWDGLRLWNSGPGKSPNVPLGEVLYCVNAHGLVRQYQSDKDYWVTVGSQQPMRGLELMQLPDEVRMALLLGA